MLVSRVSSYFLINLCLLVKVILHNFKILLKKIDHNYGSHPSLQKRAPLRIVHTFFLVLTQVFLNIEKTKKKKTRVFSGSRAQVLNPNLHPTIGIEINMGISVNTLYNNMQV